MTLDLHGGRLGVLAGSGNLPLNIIQHCQTNDIDYFVLFIKGQSDADIPSDVPHEIVKLGQIQKTITHLKNHNCTHIVFAGGVRRPSIFDMRPDMRAAKVFARLGKGALGDDRLLRAVKSEMEAEGFLVLGAHDILPDILTPEGLLTDASPNPQDWADIQTGYNILDHIGILDIGQSCVIQQGITLGVEAVEGTDALIERAGAYLRGGGGGVLVKRAKPTQDRSLDVPTVGEVTIHKLKDAGLKGLALEAGASQILNMTEAISAANAAGLFIVGITKDNLDDVMNDE